MFGTLRANCSLCDDPKTLTLFEEVLNDICVQLKIEKKHYFVGLYGHTSYQITSPQKMCISMRGKSLRLEGIITKSMYSS